MEQCDYLVSEVVDRVDDYSIPYSKEPKLIGNLNELSASTPKQGTHLKEPSSST